MAQSESAPATGGPAKVGPNAIIQLLAALRAQEGEATTALIAAAAGEAEALRCAPKEMIDETRAARLFAATMEALGAERGGAALTEAGRRTADYILAHRIPPLAQRVLRAAPALAARPVLLTAIQKSAWTFAGSGAVSVGAWPRPWIEIKDNPLASAGCPWHRAVFTRLFEALARGRGGVWRHERCCAEGAALCRFEFVSHGARGGASAQHGRKIAIRSSAVRDAG